MRAFPLAGRDAINPFREMGWTTLFVAAAVTGVLAGGLQLALDARAVSEAIVIGQSRSERDRARFHQPYRFAIDKAPVDYLELVTPFRRIVLTTEARIQVGDRSFGQRQAFEMLAAAPVDVEVYVELTFHPLNTFVGVPAYSVVMVERGASRVLPRIVERIPRHQPRVEGTSPMAPNSGGVRLPGNDQPMLGGTIIARFDTQAIHAAATYDIVVEDSGKELARARANLAALR